jgi:hypothetical protein
MEEQKINIETCALAYEKGYPIGRITHLNDDMTIKNVEYTYVPTQVLLQKWLRETHKISVEVSSGWWDLGKVEWEYSVYKKGLDGDSPCSLTVFKKYEDALEIGLQEGLKLIEIVKNK